MQAAVSYIMQAAVSCIMQAAAGRRDPSVPRGSSAFVGERERVCVCARTTSQSHALRSCSCAPASSSDRAVSTCPPKHASISIVVPFVVRVFGVPKGCPSHASSLESTAVCPCLAAQCAGPRPSRRADSTPTASGASSSTTGRCPPPAAQSSALAPCRSSDACFSASPIEPFQNEPFQTLHGARFKTRRPPSFS